MAASCSSVGGVGRTGMSLSIAVDDGLAVVVAGGAQAVAPAAFLHSFSNGMQLCSQRGTLIGSKDGGGCGAVSHCQIKNMAYHMAAWRCRAHPVVDVGRSLLEAVWLLTCVRSFG